ncbi:MAG: hypothetical protein ABI968_11220 [Acidobacteriota bacterium]
MAVLLAMMMAHVSRCSAGAKNIDPRRQPELEEPGPESFEEDPLEREIGLRKLRVQVFARGHVM